jgi:hypothetical protein
VKVSVSFNAIRIWWRPGEAAFVFSVSVIIPDGTRNRTILSRRSRIWGMSAAGFLV